MNAAKTKQVNVPQAVAQLRAGTVMAYPTESVWGLGCDPMNQAAVKQLLALKQRPMHKGVILVAGDISQVNPFLAHIDASIHKQILHSWQQQNQATTWLIPRYDADGKQAINIPQWITGKHDSVALRVSPHPLVKQLCQGFGGCIVSTSCNTAGNIPAKNVQQATEYFADGVHYLLGDTLGFEQPSQIIDARTLQILR